MSKSKIMLFIILFFSCIICVSAETGYTTDSTGINLRDYPSTDNTKSHVLLSIPYKAEFYISNLNAGVGNGCGKNWYYVYYNNKEGYVCSTLVQLIGVANTSYDRPWTSPKKAIVGGAKFISESYISKGQNTSYLKKFNVNPDGYYAVYNHQYMANLRAPSSEASTSFNSMRDNNLLDKSLEFIIPVFLNMPDSTYDSSIKQIDRPVADVQDNDFENSIKDFPDTYKPYLRYLHTVHKNWTFKPLNTNLDFESSFQNEKYVSSIEISSGQCEQNPYKQTESGWCIGNDAATKFFLDPRNFLNERYIFMFENLGFTETYNENVVQSVLKNTFMDGISALDNESYASIFVTAGRTANISPLYLASLARQESGTKLSLTTSGQEFEYEGYTYSGVFNFFNIGAYSSESNPAKAGLVWANGGKGVKYSGNVSQNNTPPSNSTEVENNFLSLLKVSRTGEYIKGYSLGTTVSQIKQNAGNNVQIIVKDSSGSVKNDGDYIGTGYIIEINDGNSNDKFTYVMFGDLSGDGEINSADLLKLRQHLLGTSKLTGAFLQSSYLNGDGDINSADLLKLRQHLLGITQITQ